MQILRIWFDLETQIFCYLSQFPTPALPFARDPLPPLTCRGVERPLAAAMLDVNPVVDHGFNYDARLFHEVN